MPLSTPAKIDRDAIIAKLQTAFGVPECPDGCGDARRPKCFYDAGAGCSRWPIVNAWQSLEHAALFYARQRQADEKDWEEDDPS